MLFYQKVFCNEMVNAIFNFTNKFNSPEFTFKENSMIFPVILTIHGKSSAQMITPYSVLNNIGLCFLSVPDFSRNY